jgi:hypothetical protein
MHACMWAAFEASNFETLHVHCIIKLVVFSQIKNKKMKKGTNIIVFRNFGSSLVKFW